MSDNEIVKALECCYTTENPWENPCKNCPLCDVEECNDVLMAEYVKDLINRLQAKVIKEQNKNSKLRNERNRLQAQNKDLAETVHNLAIEKDALFDKAEELKAEVERLKEFIVETRRCDKEIKAEAYKEFAELLCDGRVANDNTVILAK